MTEPKAPPVPETPPLPPKRLDPVPYPPSQTRQATPGLPPLPPLPPLDPPRPPGNNAGNKAGNTGGSGANGSAGSGKIEDGPAEPAPPPVPPARAPGAGNAWQGAFAVGFAVLAGGIGWIWWQQAQLAQRATPDTAAIVAPLEQQVRALDERLTKLEQQPAPAAAAPDLGQINSRLAALEERPTGSTGLRALESRVARVEQSAKAPDTAIGPRLEADEDRLASLERASGQVSTAAQRVSRLTRIRAAEVALDAGQPIGTLPDAPAELARFATAKPPTEAALRASFEPAARAALATSRPQTPAASKSFIDRMLERAQGLASVRIGDDVVVGDKTATALAHAHAALDTGDLQAAVDQVGTLSGPPAQAMASWLAQAKALAEARAALAALAAQT